MAVTAGVAAGLNGYLTIATTDVTPYMTDMDFQRMIDLVDSTAFATAAATPSTSKAYFPTLKDHTLSFSGLYEGTLASFSGILNTNFGVSAAYVYGPTGNTTAEERFTFNAFIKNYSFKNGVAGIVTASVSIQVTGAVTRDTF